MWTRLVRINWQKLCTHSIWQPGHICCCSCMLVLHTFKPVDILPCWKVPL